MRAVTHRHIRLYPHLIIYIFFLTLFLSAGYGSSFAQDNTSSISSPTLQTSSTDFFDPTKVEKKVVPYQFEMNYRVEAGYVQNAHLSEQKNYENMYLHGFRVGGTIDFLLPYKFSVQTGVLYTFTYGTTVQRWGQMSAEDFTSPDPPVTGKVYSGDITHRLAEHQLTIPVNVYYNIPLWKQLNMFFFSGPQLQIGMALKDDMDADITTATKQWFDQIGQPYEPYDRYGTKELFRTTIQWGIGGGFEWDRYRLQAGYDFGLNNQVRARKTNNQKMWEWHWFVSFAYRF